MDNQDQSHNTNLCCTYRVKMAEVIPFHQERRSPFFPCKFSSIKLF